jgi:uncharacterized protein (DUF4415 family)
MSKTTIETRDGRIFMLPSDEEDVAIHAAALADPDAQPWTDEQLESVHPRVRIGRPPRAHHAKAPVTIRLDIDLIAALKATGKGWQTRANAVLREWMEDRGQSGR